MADQVDYVGQRLGNYHLIRLLGQGGFADVYLGEHIHLKTQAAVKLLHTRLTNDDIENFRREAQTIASLVHPHIVRVLDFGVEGHAPFLVMDFAPNGTLRHRHPKGTRVQLLHVVAYVKQVADALYYAHAQRLVHRDIKPENMLLGRNNEVLLSDFGIALTSQSSSYQSTKDVAGTIAYMAPEQIQAHPRPASDQYSLGIVIYEWLSGNRPFQGTYTEVAIKHTMVPPPPLRGQVPDLPPAVEEVVMRALQKDPRRRFEDTRAFALALEQACFKGNTPMAIYPGGMYSPDANKPIDSRYSVNTPGPAQHFSQYSTQFIAPPAMTPPSQAAPPYSNGIPPVQQQQAQPQSRFSRRTVVAGIVVAAAASSGATWYLLSQKSSSSTSLLGPGSTTIPGSNGSPIASGSTATPSSSTSSAFVTYKGHTDYIWSVDWSPDGTYIVSGSSDGTAQVWEASTGKGLLSTRSHINPAVSNDWAKAVTWSPTSAEILTGFQDGTAEALDINSRQRTAVYGGDPDWTANAVAWSPDGKYVAVGRFDNTIQVYAATSGNSLFTYMGHNDGINALVLSHDGQRVASGSSDGTAQVWRASDGHPLLIYKNHTSDVRSVSWSPDDKYIVSGSSDGTAQVWESVSGHTLLTYTKHTGGLVNAVAWSHHGSYIASGGNDVNTHIWEAQSGNLLHTCYTFPIFGVAWAPDDSRIVTGGYKKIGQVWSAK